MKKKFIYILLIVFTFACKKEPPKKKEALITDVEFLSSNVEGLSVSKVITFDDQQVAFLLPNQPIPKSIAEIKVKVNFKVSDKATISETPEMIFTKPEDSNIINVIAENGEVKEWKIYFAGNQLAYADFETWEECTHQGIQYREPVAKENIFWSTPNFMSLKYDIVGVSRFPDGDSKHVKIETKSTSQYPLLSSCLFNGIFVNKEKVSPRSIKVDIGTGIPYSLKPKALKVTYRYQPGVKTIRATPINGSFSILELDETDQCQILGKLVHKLNGREIEIGHVEFTSSRYTATAQPIVLNFKYMDTELNPTHFVFFATSSYKGYMFEGAEGSILTIDNLEFVF